jgi:hypothetical protein
MLCIYVPVQILQYGCATYLIFLAWFFSLVMHFIICKQTSNLFYNANLTCLADTACMYNLLLACDSTQVYLMLSSSVMLIQHLLYVFFILVVFISLEFWCN